MWSLGGWWTFIVDTALFDDDISVFIVMVLSLYYDMHMNIRQQAEINNLRPVLFNENSKYGDIIVNDS